METLISGVGLAAVSAVSVIAYKHPASFKPLSLAIFSILMFAQLAAVAYDAGVYAGTAAIRTALQPELNAAPLASNSFERMRSATDTAVFGFKVHMGLLIGIAYIWLLRFLPEMGITAATAPSDKG